MSPKYQPIPHQFRPDETGASWTSANFWAATIPATPPPMIAIAPSSGWNFKLSEELVAIFVQQKSQGIYGSGKRLLEASQNVNVGWLDVDGCGISCSHGPILQVKSMGILKLLRPS